MSAISWQERRDVAMSRRWNVATFQRRDVPKPRRRVNKNRSQCFVLIHMPNSIPKRRNYGFLAL